MKGLTKTTKSIRPAEVEKKWVLIDADGLVVGRLAAIIAVTLRGKNKPSFTPHVDCGDNVIVINAEKVRFTGKKIQQKRYFRHTGYAGGLKSVTAEALLDGRFPTRVLEKAVAGMIPKGPLGRQQMRNLRIFAGVDHPHGAQQPEPLDIAGRNLKNVGGAGTRGSGGYISNGSADPVTKNIEPLRERRLLEPVVNLALLIQQLDNPQRDARHTALKRLMRSLPIFINPSDEDAESYAVQLRRLRNRLLKAIIDDARNPAAARHAGLALAKVICPRHYSDDLDQDQIEHRALEDLETYAQTRRLDFFFTIEPHMISNNIARIEARLWNRLPFRLQGQLPRLRNDAHFAIDADMSIRSEYLTVISTRRTAMHEELDGQLIGTILEVELNRHQAGKTREFPVDIFVGDRLIDQHTLYRHQLFES